MNFTTIRFNYHNQSKFFFFTIFGFIIDSNVDRFNIYIYIFIYILFLKISILKC